MLDKYKSMDELKTDVEQMKPFLPAEEYELIQYACGLLENQGISEEVDIQGNQVRIDKYLAPMIKDLNQRGILTLACCSGLQAEHMDVKYKPEGQGYLCIEYDQQLHESLRNKTQGMDFIIEKSDCYLKDSIRILIKGIDDNELKEKWSSLWEILKQLSLQIK